MNEEERRVYLKGYSKGREEGILIGEKEGFQKGKLEQKKEELEFLISEYFVYLNIDGGFIRDKIVKRIKQLQEEIGGKK